MKYKLVIFDMDGLLLDTEIIYYKTWFEFTDKYNFTYNLEKRKLMAGMNDKAIEEVLNKDIKSMDKVKKLREELNDYRNDLFKNIDKSLKKEGVDEILEFLKNEKVKIALASSSPREKIERLLEKEGILSYFDLIVSGEDVEKSKPDPYIFLKVIEILKAEKNETLILEDSYNGYLAAKNSGADYFVIHDTSFEKNFDADRQAQSLKEVIKLIK